MSLKTKILNIFSVSKYDVEKDKEMELKDKVFEITNKTNFKVSKIETKAKHKVEKLRNAKTTRLDKLNRKLTRIRMTKFNEARYIAEDSCILDTIAEEETNTKTETKTKTKKETK